MRVQSGNQKSNYYQMKFNQFKYSFDLPKVLLRIGWRGFIVLTIGLLLTVGAALYTGNLEVKTRKKEFAADCRDIELRMSRRLHTYALLLRSGSAFLYATDSVTRKEWREFIEKTRIDKNLAGVQGVGYAVIIPENKLQKHYQQLQEDGFKENIVKLVGKRDIYTSIIYLEPFTDRNLRAFGYDMYSESVRHQALVRARDLDKTTMSGKVRLLQETDEHVQAGFLMFVPVYRNDRPHNTLEERRSNIIGWVYAPFRIDDLMHGILGEQNQNFDLEIYDGDASTHDTLMTHIENGTTPNSNDTAQYQFSKKIEFADHFWTITLHSLPIFEARIDTTRAMVIRQAGILSTLLLTLLVTLLSYGWLRSRKLAELRHPSFTGLHFMQFLAL